VASEFYAALIEDSYHVEGDERSKTNPGHGYPAHDVKYTRIEEFAERVQRPNNNPAQRVYAETAG